MSMIDYIKLPLLLTGIVLLTGCATSIKYKISGDDVVKKSNFELVDKRDESQKKAEIMSLSVTNCWYGIYRLGDDQIVPDRMAILSKELEDNIGRKLEGKKVIVYKFEIFNNLQSGTRDAAAGGGAAGLMGFPFGPSVDAVIAAYECKKAAFSLEENPSIKPSVVVVMDVDIDGKRIEEKIVQIEPEGVNDARGSIVTERVKRAVYAAVKKVVEMASK